MKRPTMVYTVYDNRTDFPVIVDGFALECAKVMGISEDSFYRTVYASGKSNKRWTILKSSRKEAMRDETEDTLK